MDPVSHTLVGAALAQTGLQRRSAYGAAALIIGANLPDLDAVTMFISADTALLWRRGWTHGIAAVAVLPLLLTALLCWWHRRAGRRRAVDRLRPGALLGLAYLAVATHPALDWLNNYGMRWWMPFDGRWSYGDAVFIVDPWFWLILGGAVFLGRSRGVWSLLRWAIFAGLAVWLLRIGVPELQLARALWGGGVILFILLWLKGVGREETVAGPIATFALAALGLYIGAMVASARYARRAVEAELTARGLRVEKLMVGPMPVTPFVRDVVVATPDGYRYGTARLWPRFELELAPRALPRLPRSALVGTALSSPAVRGFANWARFPFAEIEERASDYAIYMMDARYVRRRRVGFGSARVAIPKAQLRSASD